MGKCASLDIKKIIKNYKEPLICLAAYILTFGFSLLLSIIDDGFGTLIIPLWLLISVFFCVFYGVIACKCTGHVILPNILLFVTMYLFFLGFSRVANPALAAMEAGISFLFSLITKLMLFINARLKATTAKDDRLKTEAAPTEEPLNEQQS